MATGNSVIIGRVGEISGKVYIKLPSGELVPLKEGMVVHANDVIVTADGGSILVYLANGTVFTLGQNTVARLDDDVMPKADVEELKSNQNDVKDLAEKVLSGHASDLDATAAGQDGGQQNSSSSQTPDSIQADRAQGHVTSGFDTGSDAANTTQTVDQTANNNEYLYAANQQTAFSVSLDIDRITSDSLVNAREANGNIAVTGQVSGQNLDHGTVTLTINGNQYSGNFGSDGKYAISVPGTDFTNDSDQVVDATATAYNSSGEQATSTSTEFYLIDTNAGRVFVDPVTGDNLVAGNEDQNVTISGSTTSIAPGQTVTVEVVDEAGNNKFTGSATVGTDGKWSIPNVDMSGWPDEANYQVIANSVDSAGNPAFKGEQDFSTRVTQSDSIIISENTVATGNVLANDSNPNHTLQVTSFSVAGDSQSYSAGQTVSLTGVGQVTMQSDGSYKFTPDHNWDGSVPQITYQTNINEHDTLDIKVLPAGSASLGTVTIDPVTSDNVVNSAESNATVAVTGTATGGDVKSGDTVTLTIHGVQYSTTVGSDGKWSVNVAGTDLATDSDKAFSATVASKNSSGATVISSADHSYTVDTTADKGTVTIDDVTKDNVINAAESGQTIAVTGTATGGDISSGDTLTMSINNQNYSTTVNSDGSWSVDVAGSDLAADADKGFTASVGSTDAAGNPVTSTADHSYTVDTTADKGTVTIDDVTKDNVINAAESGQTIAVTGTATGGDISSGDTLTMSINNQNYSTTVNSDGSWSVDVAGSDLAADADKGFTASVGSTDAAGNPVTSTADHSYTVDTTAPDAPLITNVTDTNGNYSNVILHGTGEPGATISVYSREGSTTSSNNTGSWTYTSVETQSPIVVDANGNWTLDISNLPNTPVNDNEFFKATQTDAAGNVSAESDAVHYWHGDWSSVNTETQDDYVMMGSGQDTINIVSNDANDKFVVDGGDGTDRAVFNGKFSDYALSTNSNGSLIVTEGANTDSDGNGTGDVDELRNIETVKFTDGTYDVPTGVFTLNDIQVDIEHDAGTSDSDRITNDSTLKISGLVPGATLEFSSDGGKTWSSQYNPEEGVNNISVRQVDGEGHTSDNTDVSFTLDTQAGANIDVDKITGDGFLTAADSEPGVKVPVTGYVQGDAQPGDAVSITLDGKVIGTGTVSSDVNSNGEYTFSIDVLGSDLANGSGVVPELKATVTGSDVAGNNFSVDTTEVYGKDLTATVSVSASDSNSSDSDNVVSASEATSTVISGNVEAGGQVKSITISDGTHTLTIPADQVTTYDNGYYTVNADVSSLNDGTLTVNVEGTDKLGNVGTNSTSIEKDTQAQTGTISVNSITEDNIVNSNEGNGTIAVTGTASGGDISSGDTLTMTINGKEYTTSVAADGSWSVDVAGSDLTSDSDKNFTVSVASTDDAGNKVTSSTTHSYTVDSLPEGHDESQSMDFESASAPEQTTNVVVTLDISGSMDSGSRMTLAKSALEKMINTYDDQGTVNVKLVAFNEHGTVETEGNNVWLKADDAISIIKDLQAGGSTNYEDAVLKTYQNYSEPSADKTVAYFISDGAPTTENNDGWNGNLGLFDNIYRNGWNEFVQDHVNDLHVVALGDDAKDSQYLKDLASAGDNVSTVTEVSDASQLSDAIVPVTTELSVNGTVSDNVTGGDGAITVQSIQVDGTTYTSSTFPNDGVSINGKGTLTFDFSTGNYTYSASSNEFTKDVSESFKVTMADADGDTASVNVGINVNVDDTATAATLNMSIGQPEVHTTSNYTYDDHDARNANYDSYNSLHDALEGQDGNNHSDGTLVYKNVNNTSWNLSDSSDKLFAITGNSHNANINLSGGNNTLIFEEDPSSNVSVNFGSGKDVLMLPGSESDYNLNAFHNNGGILSGQITGHDNMSLTVNNLDCLVFSDQVIGDSSLYKGETSTSYDYGLNASASLTDTDGSESLSSDITISGLPKDNSVSVTGTGVTENTDGTYKVALQDDGKVADDVKMSSSRELTSDELNNVHASVTSTESNGGDTATTEVNESGDNFLYADTGDDLFVGTNQADHFKVDNDGSTTIQNFDVQNDVLDLSDVIADDHSVTEDSLSQYLKDHVSVTQTSDGNSEVAVKDDAGSSVANIMLEGLNDSNNLQIQVDDNKVDYSDS